jgi:hypothetical protein
MAKMTIQDADDLENAPAPKAKVEKVTIPNGYIPIELSTQGLLGVPKVVHCRNFSTADILDLSLFNESMLPERVVSVLNSIILEKTDVSNWPDRCIVELLIKLYVNFFTPVLPQISFPWTYEDIKWLEDNERAEDARNLELGKWVPRIDFNLTDVKINNLDSEVKSFITVTKKDSTFHAKFISYPRYGDVIAVKKATEAKFAESDKNFERIKQDVSIRERFLSEGRNISALETVNDQDYSKWRIHETKKAIYVAKASQALYLVEFNGIDLSNATIDEKIEFIDHPEFDIKLAQRINRQFEKLNFGIDPQVEIMNPITGLRCLRTFTFRLMDILQAIQLSESDEYDITYDE